jgi:hypothetical protein
LVKIGQWFSQYGTHTEHLGTLQKRSKSVCTYACACAQGFCPTHIQLTLNPFKTKVKLNYKVFKDSVCITQ